MQAPPKHLLSKSTFMDGLQCPKRLWLHKHLPKEKDVQSTSQRAIFQQGTDVGEIARKLFPGGIDASPENYYSYQKSVADTIKYLRNGHQVIYEAAFQFEGILCAIDILVNINNQWHAFEVKSTTSLKEAHIWDTALQYYVITGAGIDLEDISIIHLNKHYIRQGILDIHQLFTPVSLLTKVRSLQPKIFSKASELSDVLASNIPPDIKVGPHCNIPYPCDFQRFCNEGVLPCMTTGREEGANFKLLQEMKGQLSYPHYFLHLDAWSNSIPLLDGHWPYKQVCFQYSLHKLENENAGAEHFYFLSEGLHGHAGVLIKNLLSALGDKGNIFIHNTSFTHYRLKEYGREFPAFSSLIQLLLLRMHEWPEPFYKDVVLQKRDNNILSGLSPSNIVAGEGGIRDHQSAAVGFLNMALGYNEETPQIVRDNLKNYAVNSTLKMMRWFRTV